MDKTRHQIAINFYSEPFLWHDTAGNYLLVSGLEQETGEEVFIHMFDMQPYLSIYSLHTDQSLSKEALR